jgi:hypothetical protein
VSAKRLVPLVLAGAGVLASACSAPPLPEVTFFAAGTTVSTGPAQYCASDLSSCPVQRQAGVKLHVPSNKPLQISVPSEVAKAVWCVAFSYRKPDGSTADARTEFFPAGDQWAYTLRPPEAGDQLLVASVEKIATVMTLGDDGQVGFHASGVWLLDASS